MARPYFKMSTMIQKGSIKCYAACLIIIKIIPKWSIFISKAPYYYINTCNFIFMKTFWKTAIFIILKRTPHPRVKLLDIFTDALTKLDDRKNLSRFCPVCNRRKLPKVDPENIWTEELGKYFDLASTPDQHDITAVNKVDDITFNNDAINSLLTKWLNSKLADKPYSDFGDEISFGSPNDGFSRLFSKVAMDHRMNIIR